MKILQSAQFFLDILGIRPKQSLANVNFFMVEFSFCTTVTSSLLFLIYEAKTFYEYTLAIFESSTYAMAAMCFTILAKEKRRLFKTIDLVEEIIEKSK